MKNQIIKLMLSAAFLTTSPLFAMELPQDEEFHTCQVCAKDKTGFFELTEGEPTAGKGNMYPLPDDVMTRIIIESGKGAVTSLMYTSKYMYNLCQKPSVWHGFAQKERFLKFEPELCPKYQVCNFYNLFKFDLQKYELAASQGKAYYEHSTITASQLIHFQQNHYVIETEEMKKTKQVASQYPHYYEKELLLLKHQMPNNSWLFEIGNRKFILKNSKECDDDYLNSLEANTDLTFAGRKEPASEKIPFSSIKKHVLILKKPEDCIIKNQEGEIIKILKFGSKEYTAVCEEAPEENVHVNFFNVNELPD